jgi:hypothetical protein
VCKRICVSVQTVVVNVEQGRKSLHKRVGNLDRKDAGHTLTIHTLLNAQGAAFVGASIHDFRIRLARAGLIGWPLRSRAASPCGWSLAQVEIKGDSSYYFDGFRID